MVQFRDLFCLVLCGALATSCLAAADSNDDNNSSPRETNKHNLPDEAAVTRVFRQIALAEEKPLGNEGVPSESHDEEVSGRPTRQSLVSCSDCVPLVSCTLPLSLVVNTCFLSDSQLGVCCPLQTPTSVPSMSNALFSPFTKKKVMMHPIQTQVMDEACAEGINYIKNVTRLEKHLVKNNLVLQPDTPAYRHLTVFRVTRSALDSNRKAAQITHASSVLARRLDLTNDQSSQGLRQFPVHTSILSKNCPVAPKCSATAAYRTTDGSCNNLLFPLQGKSETAFQRLMPSKYDDGVASPHMQSIFGGELPNVRVVSQTILQDSDNPDRHFTMSVMQWGQFVDHDITHAPFQAMEANGHGIECCANGEEITGPNRHAKCWPINLPRNDYFYSQKGVYCQNFIRSMQAINEDCTFGPAEQMNQITHWLDASNIYGSTIAEANRLRLRRGGLLRVSDNNFLPIGNVSVHDCSAAGHNGICYVSGDTRVNEQPGLTVNHLMFHREHNRLAEALAQMNPSWTDSQIYYEVRRIVCAEIQHITYNEWLPIILGERYMASSGMQPSHRGFRYDYNPQINANIMNEFATSAFRFGHSLVQGKISLGRGNSIRLRDYLGSPHLFSTRRGAVDNLVLSFIGQPIQKFDHFVSADLTNHLFETPLKGFGLDLMSINIHRGRDHAIASYNEMREVCGLSKATRFEDFSDQMTMDVIGRLKSLYTHVEDVDFFVGGISEKPVVGGLLGWTFLCIVGDQFARTRNGDRFFYDLGGQPGSFTENQLREIFKVSWARILCDNSGVEDIQPLAFRLPDQRMNIVQNCHGSAIPRLDHNRWKGA